MWPARLHNSVIPAGADHRESDDLRSGGTLCFVSPRQKFERLGVPCISRFQEVGPIQENKTQDVHFLFFEPAPAFEHRERWGTPKIENVLLLRITGLPGGEPFPSAVLLSTSVFAGATHPYSLLIPRQAAVLKHHNRQHEEHQCIVQSISQRRHVVGPGIRFHRRPGDCQKARFRQQIGHGKH
jgi:hypothetical protein